MCDSFNLILRLSLPGHCIVQLSMLRVCVWVLISLIRRVACNNWASTRIEACRTLNGLWRSFLKANVERVTGPMAINIFTLRRAHTLRSLSLSLWGVSGVHGPCSVVHRPDSTLAPYTAVDFCRIGAGDPAAFWLKFIFGFLLSLLLLLLLLLVFTQLNWKSTVHGACCCYCCCCCCCWNNNNDNIRICCSALPREWSSLCGGHFHCFPNFVVVAVAFTVQLNPSTTFKLHKLAVATTKIPHKINYSFFSFLSCLVSFLCFVFAPQAMFAVS